MVRLLLTALLMSMSANAGMGMSMQRWKQLRTRGAFVGVFRDYRGARAAFFVEDKSGALIGPLDLDKPNGPGWAVTPGPGPEPSLQPGDQAEIVYAAIFRADRPFGHPPAEDLAKSRADRRPQDPADGMLVSVEKRPGRGGETEDPLGLALSGRMPALGSEDDRRQAAVGFLLRRDAAQFRATRPPADLARLGAVIFGGLPALEGPLAPVARLWLAGKKPEARALVKDFWLGSDRWRRPPHPMESSPGMPLQGPFLRWQEWGDADALALHYLAPEFVKFLVAASGWHDPPY